MSATRFRPGNQEIITCMLNQGTGRVDLHSLSVHRLTAHRRHSMWGRPASAVQGRNLNESSSYAPALRCSGYRQSQRDRSCPRLCLGPTGNPPLLDLDLPLPLHSSPWSVITHRRYTMWGRPATVAQDQKMTKFRRNLRHSIVPDIWNVVVLKDIYSGTRPIGVCG